MVLAPQPSLRFNYHDPWYLPKELQKKMNIALSKNCNVEIISNGKNLFCINQAYNLFFSKQ